MYLSRLRIKNYRSIKNLDLKFKKGKNIIVGKNNAGKSNVIKAIDLILGENSPTYQKSENVTENDFHAGKKDESILIFCELTRDNDEELNYEEIYKCPGYKYHIKITEWENRKPKIKVPIYHLLRIDTLSNFWSDLEALMNITEEEVDTDYVNPKLKNQLTFENQFHDKFQFAYAFRATLNASNKMEKEIRFFYRNPQNEGWIMCFSAPIRNEFLQSAIIPSFRDPSSELRINQWTWFGKLLKASINPDQPGLREAFAGLKSASDGVFQNLKEEINENKVKIAFPDTVISFQFNPETRIDVYKSTLIYVDDGFNSLLHDKGSGIQSAVTIGLFHYYTRNISHCSCSLLAIEEPEVYLHPQARRVISNRLDDFLEGTKNQVIITTHSSEFITTAHEELNIILVKKDLNSGTVATNTSFSNSKEKQILVKTQNAEMFFADKVLLVEGGDKYILEAVAKYYGTSVKPELGENWLNDKNYSVISVGGKTEFWKYFKKLNELKIKPFILADFDFFLRKLNEFFTNIGAKPETLDELNALKSKIGMPQIEIHRKILDGISDFQLLLNNEGYTIDEKELRVKLKEPFKIKRLSQIDEQHHANIKSILEKYKTFGIFILENELEDYYTDLCKKNLRGLSGKEERPIHITSQLVSNESPINTLINCDEFISFLNKATE
jgi:putative ATP-dependent endonuclease of OLD family